MTMVELEERVVEWAEVRGIFTEATDLNRLNKLLEEVDELEEALMQIYPRNTEEIKLEAGDVIVTLINLLHPIGLDLETCLDAAYQKIKNRKGEVVNGMFVKEKP